MFPETIVRNYLNDLVGYVPSGGVELMPNWADQEAPTGTINGVNGTFSLANSPLPMFSLILVFNTTVMKQGLDYTLSGNVITFISGFVPQVGDVLVSWYRYATSGSTTVPNFGDQEVPGGAINGVNTSFTLTNSPSPTTSLILVLNGMVLTQGTDYILSGNIITFTALWVPQFGDTLECWYRY